MYSKGNKRLPQAVIIAIWLILWQLISMRVDNSILLVGPLATLRVLLEKVAEISFWQSILGSFFRIVAGFLAGWILGLILAAISGGYRWFEDLIRPAMSLIKTVPVASFVVLFLIWFRTDVLAMVISMFVVLPNVYLNTLEGIKSTDKKLLEMAAVYEIHPLDKFFYIYRPALKPFWESCRKMSVGMSWKSGVAAEVIGTPDFSVGEQLYMSKIHLDTGGVLAWTVVIILVSMLCEKVFLGLWDRFLKWQPECKGVLPAGNVRNIENVKGMGDVENTDSAPGLYLENIWKSYGENQLYEEFNSSYEKGQIYYFRTPSGSGKTTLFRMIAGLEMPDEGQIFKTGRIAYAFQEDRLCEAYSAIKNLELVCGNTAEAGRYLAALLEEEDLQKPCSQLSGGMRRRVEVARAFAAQREIVLLDEPFAGLDEENRRKMQEYIEEHGRDKVVLISSHV